MLTQEMMVEAAKLLRTRKQCTRSPCTTNCDDCRAHLLAKELDEAAPKLKDGIWLIQKIDECPGDHFTDDVVCTACGMHARYHRSEKFLRHFAEGVSKAIKGIDETKTDQDPT